MTWRQKIVDWAQQGAAVGLGIAVASTAVAAAGLTYVGALVWP